MSLINLSLLAQANPAVENVSAGQILSGLLVLAVMAASLVMIVVWVVRIGQSGHALPAAQRGILRVPPALTFVAIGLSLLMLLLMALAPAEDQILPAAAANPPALAADDTDTTVTTPASSEPIVGENAANPAAGSPPADGSNPTDVSTTSEGSTTSSSAAEPVAPVEQGNPAEEISVEAGSQDSESAQPENAAFPASDDEATADTPSVPDDAGNQAAAPRMTPAQMKNALIQTVILDLFLFALLGLFVFLASSNGRVALQDNGAPLPSPKADDFADPPYSGSTLWPDLDDRSAIPQHPGYSILGESESFWTAEPPKQPEPAGTFNALAASTTTVSSGEQFSFLTELRFAGEVFLAAYVPTAILRIIIVLLTVGLMGEEPEQHPFLEMMSSGVGSTVLILILLTAVFLAPLVEELQFRVIMLGGLAQLGRPMLALSLSSVLFAFAHGFPDSLALLPLAFVLGYTYLRRRSYITVMMVHLLFNGFNMVLALMAML